MTKKHFLALARALAPSASSMTPFAFEQMLYTVSAMLEENFPAFRRQAFFDAVKVNTPKRAVTTLEPK
jgi:hypothetical protein